MNGQILKIDYGITIDPELIKTPGFQKTVGYQAMQELINIKTPLQVWLNYCALSSTNTASS